MTLKMQKVTVGLKLFGLSLKMEREPLEKSISNLILLRDYPEEGICKQNYNKTNTFQNVSSAYYNCYY